MHFNIYFFILQLLLLFLLDFLDYVEYCHFRFGQDSPAIPFNLFFPMSGCCHWRQTTYSSIHTIFTNNNNNFFNWNYTVNNYNVFPLPIYIVASSPLFYFYAKHRNDEIVSDVVDFIKKPQPTIKILTLRNKTFTVYEITIWKIHATDELTDRLK